MNLIGRRLQIRWGDNIVVAIDKIVIKQADDAIIYDIYEVDGTILYVALGSSSNFMRGRTLDYYMNDPSSFK